MKITEHLVMIMVKSIKIFDVSHADFSLSPIIKARYFCQVKVVSSYTLLNVRQMEFVLLNEPFVQSGCVPALSFSVASEFVDFLPCSPYINLALLLHNFSKLNCFIYHTVLKPKKNLLGYFDIPWIPLMFAQCCK